MQPYKRIEELFELMEDPQKSVCQNIFKEHKARFMRAPGSLSKHQVWEGGYIDHVTEVMNLGVVLFNALNECRQLPFTRSDVLVVLFCHDIDKPWKFAEGRNVGIESDEFTWKIDLLASQGLELNEMQKNALRYSHGELDDYDPNRRVMNELAALVHSCDVMSARLWHDRPLASGETWGARYASKS